MDGLRFWSLATGTPVPGNATEIIEHQMSSVRRACQRTDPPNVRTRPPLQLHAEEPADQAEQAPLPWWKRD